LQKALAHAGIGSRRSVEELIAGGRVTVNGHTAVLGARVDLSKDVVEVDGSRVALRPALVHYLLNKPRGVITTAVDPRGRPSVLDLVEVGKRVWPVGRLDADTEGALIITNDGELTRRLTHPSFGVIKTYLAQVRDSIGRPALRKLEHGVTLEDGVTRPAMVRVVQRERGLSLVEITIAEGRNRQIRRMFEVIGHPVARLVRTGIGPLMLGRLPVGTVRRLNSEEVRALYRACGL
jgi:23S rRNA pseudouridine2605 synthase